MNVREVVAIGAACALLVFGCRREKPDQSKPFVLAPAFPACSTDVKSCEANCTSGSAEDCYRFANQLSAGIGLAKDEARATALFVQACAKGVALACVDAGRMQEFGHGVPKNDTAARDAYHRGCELGNVTACYNEAILAEAGRGGAKDTQRALALYQKACTAGSKTACGSADRLFGAP